MKRTQLILVVVLAIWLIGCGGGHSWKNDTIPEKMWDRDYAECMQQAGSEVEIFKPGDPTPMISKQGEARYLIQKCMEAKGYYR